MQVCYMLHVHILPTYKCAAMYTWCYHKLANSYVWGAKRMSNFDAHRWEW